MKLSSPNTRCFRWTSQLNHSGLRFHIDLTKNDRLHTCLHEFKFIVFKNTLCFINSCSFQKHLFETIANTRCFSNERKHKVFSKRSQTQGVFEASWNTRCFRNELKHKVFSKRSQTQGVFEKTWNTRCFRNDRTHKVLSKRPKTQGVFWNTTVRPMISSFYFRQLIVLQQNLSLVLCKSGSGRFLDLESTLDTTLCFLNEVRGRWLMSYSFVWRYTGNCTRVRHNSSSLREKKQMGFELSLD